MINKDNCKWCDYICEDKKQGIKCFNPKSESFNQKVNLDDSCEFIEHHFYVNPKDEDEKGLFDEVLH